MLFYLFIVSSLNNPIYREIHEKRRKLLHDQEIPYTVLVNHKESDLKDMDIKTLIPLEDDEVLYNGEGYNPFMAQKFMYAVKMYFRSFRSFDDVPPYIVRINATVYVHFPALIALLKSPGFPRERVLAGWDWGSGSFVQGMIMIFSKDVLFNMIRDRRMYDKEVMNQNDDVSLSILSEPYCTRYNIFHHLTGPDPTNVYNGGIYDMGIIRPKENQKWIFRVCNQEDRNLDKINWDILLDYFGDSVKKEGHISSLRWVIICLCFLMILVFIVLFLWRRVDNH